jgi:hypothetical protein
MTFLAVYERYTGKTDDVLMFVDAYKTEAQLNAAGRYWFNEWDFTMTRYEDLWPDESPLERTRRIRNKKWESWR